jgi:hypothetical protein
MDAVSELSSKSVTYVRLREIWLDAREVIAEQPKLLEIPYYSVAAENTDESWLQS